MRWATLLHGLCRYAARAPPVLIVDVLVVPDGIKCRCRCLLCGVFQAAVHVWQGLIRHFRDEMEDRITQASERIAA